MSDTPRTVDEIPLEVQEHLCGDFSRDRCGDPTMGDCSCRRLVRWADAIRAELAAEKASREKAEAERDALWTKWERGCFCLMEMMQAYERRIRSLSTPAEIEKKPWECAEYRSAADYLRSAWHQQPDDSARRKP